jgi:NAD(P)-dependent dehydrogenase (short-subunit alcohol dehydrogenase family)
MSAKPVCVIVGIGESLGASLARRFGAGGYAVALIGRRAAEVERHVQALSAQGLEARGFPGDATDPAAVGKIFSAIRETLGDPEVLIYNAAIVGPGRLTETDFDTFRRRFAVDTEGALLAIQQVVPAMRRAGRGTLLFSGGSLATRPNADWGVLAAGKAAQRAMVIALDQELRGDGIHVATVEIHGHIQSMPYYAPDRLAEAFWALHQQPPAEFETELVYREPT